jgi:nucleotide-binding universal stress UspA family protein
MQYANVDEAIILRYRHAAQQEALRRLRQLAVDEKLPEPETRLLALPGNAARLILEQEQEEDCDLIVVGKHGINMVEELLLGSTTKHVLGEAQGDVLVSV